ncbi:MAG: sulfotransferase [Paracoccaceae bacterium]
MTSPVPILILGIQRSGTTYAANLLAAHPEIAAVTDARHQGVHESVFFSHFARMFGDWSVTENRDAAVAEFLRSDYFVLCRADAAETRAAMLLAPTAAEAFRRVMDAVATRAGAKAWLEKSPHHTLLADRIAADLPDAQFLCVTRETEDFIRSRLWSFGRVPPPYPRRAALIAKACASNVLHGRYMAGLTRRLGPARVHHIRYDQLRRDADVALDPLLCQIGLRPQAGRRPAFAPNSSFANAAERHAALSRADRVLIRMFDLAMRALPQPLLMMLQRRIADTRPMAFPQWVRTPAIAGARDIEAGKGP